MIKYPDIDKPVVTVNTVYRGASAEIIERDITQILEDSVSYTHLTLPTKRIV